MKAELSSLDSIVILGTVTASFFNAAICLGVVVEHKGKRYNVMVEEGVLSIIDDEYPNLDIGQLIKGEK